MDDHLFFTVKKISHKYCAIRYTPRPTPGYGGKLVFNMEFDVLIAGQSLADKEVSLQLIADTLNNAVARDGEKDTGHALKQAARNLLAALTAEGDVERLAARNLAALLEPESKSHV